MINGTGAGLPNRSLQELEEPQTGESPQTPLDADVGTVDGHLRSVEELGDTDAGSSTNNDPPHTANSDDVIEPALLSEAGTYFWITIGITCTPLAVTSSGEAIPRWGVGLFFDQQYIPVRFKEAVQRSNGTYYRPEMRFWSQEDAKTFATSIAQRFKFKLDPGVFGSPIIPDSPIDPVTQALTMAKDAGMKLNNLFQDSDGNWRCNLRQENYYDYGGGETAHDAIVNAIHNTGAMTQLSYSAAKRKRK